MGYHDWHEIPNYWNYARNFVLQDHMFEAVNAWSLPAHLSTGLGLVGALLDARRPDELQVGGRRRRSAPPATARRSTSPGPTSRGSCTATT